jgi:hypothetical protein
MEVSGQIHTPIVLPQGKSPWYALDNRMDIQFPDRDLNPELTEYEVEMVTIQPWYSVVSIL